MNQELRDSVRRGLVAIAAYLGRMSDANFTGELEYSVNMNHGGVTRVKLRSTSDILDMKKEGKPNE